MEPLIKIFSKIKTLIPGLIFCVILFGSCKKEFSGGKENSVLQYEPFGPDKNVVEAGNSKEGFYYALINNYRLIKVSGEFHKADWDTSLEISAKRIIRCIDNSVITIGNYFSYDCLSYNRFSAEGTKLFQSNWGEKMFPEFPDYIENYSDACSDGANGAYLLVILKKQGTYSNEMPDSTIYLVHLNAMNGIDKKIQLHGYYLRITADQNGNLYGVKMSTINNVITDLPDTLEVCKFDMNALNANTIVKEWKQDVYKTPYYAYDYWNLDMNLCLGPTSVYLVLPEIVPTNIECGAEFYEWDKVSGLLRNHNKYSDVPKINSYLDNAEFVSAADESGCYTSLKFAAQTKLIHFNRSGNFDLNTDLKGANNRTNVNAMAFINNHLTIYGSSSHGKSSGMIPFLYTLTE